MRFWVSTGAPGPFVARASCPGKSCPRWPWHNDEDSNTALLFAVKGESEKRFPFETSSYILAFLTGHFQKCMGESSVHLKSNHGLRCASRLGVRRQQPPPFRQLTAIVHLHHHHEKTTPNLASALAQFSHGARTESGGCCHRTLRRLRRCRFRSSTPDEMFCCGSGALWPLCARITRPRDPRLTAEMEDDGPGFRMTAVECFLSPAYAAGKPVIFLASLGVAISRPSSREIFTIFSTNSALLFANVAPPST